MPKKKDAGEGSAPVRFQGYASPNYTMVPDELFDKQLPDLSGAELKVLLYIIRRTFGFKKDSDNISLSQLLYGITTHAGQQLDRGTGLSKQAIVVALRGLAEKNLIIPERRSSPEKGHEATNYRLNVLTHPSLEIRQGLSKNQTRLVKKVDTQETVRQKTVRQETEDSSKREIQLSTESNLKGGLGGGTITSQSQLPEAPQEIRPAKNQSPPTSRKSVHGPSADILLALPGSPSQDALSPDANVGTAAKAPTSPPGFSSVGQVIARRQATSNNAPQGDSRPRRTAAKSTAVLEDPNSVAGRKKAQERPQKPRGRFLATPYLDRVIEEFSRLELRDPEHVNSNLRQARNLLVASGKEEDDFVYNFVYKARAQTRASANVNNRGAYFFTCLRQELGMREDEAGPIPPMKRGASDAHEP